MNDKDFLQGYEIKNWEFSPRIYKIIATATVLNLVSLFALAQTNLLATSACNSPFVNRVCQVLDTVYVGSKLFSGDKDYIVEEYNKTQIQDDEVVWVDSTNLQPQLNYPTGYFEIANRDEIAAEKALLEDPQNTFNNTTPPFTPTPINPPPAKTYPRPPRIARYPRSNSLAKKQKLPKKNNKVIDGEIDEDLFKIDEDPKKNDTTAGKNKNGEDDSTKKNPIADNSANASDSVKDININKKPLQDFADTIVVKWAKKEVDLNKQFRIRFKGKLTAEGKIDRDKSGFDSTADQGDEQMIRIAKDAIEAVGDSGWLGYLRNLGAKEITITFVQNEDNIVARVESTMKSENEAKTLASGANGAISLAKLRGLGEDETKLLNAAKTPTNQGKVFILDFVMKKTEAHEIINRKLGEELAKKQKEENGKQTLAQPNGTTKQSDSNANLAK